MNLVTNNQNTNTSNTFPAIQNHDDLIQAVDAKELYKSLGLNTTQWARWSTNNIEVNPFAVEGLDFEGFDTVANGNKTRNYLLSINFAKKLAMQVRTEEGEKVREYFLECEESAKQNSFKIPTTLGEALQLAANQAMKIEADAKKVNHYDTVVDRYNLMTATQVGQKLGMTANKLNKHLEELGAYNRTVKRGRAFQQWFIDNGYGVMKEANKGYSQALFTSKGQAYIVEQLTFNKVVSEEVTERLEARSNHTANVINRIDSLLIH